MLSTQTSLNINSNNIKAYMRSQLDLRPEYFDTYNCGEINMTLLAEDAAQEFDLYEDDVISEGIFEIAFEVAEEYEIH